MASPLVPILSLAATVMLGFIAALIAYQQWKLAQNKLRLELFEKRYRVYRGFVDYLALISLDDESNAELLSRFQVETSDVGFLFGSDVVKYYRLVRRKTLRLRSLRKKVNAKSNPMMSSSVNWDIPVSVMDEVFELEEWISKQFTEVQSIFKPYLSFSEIRDHSWFDRLVEFSKGNGDGKPMV